MSELHTKHRPTTFDEVVGQGDVVPALRAALKENRGRAFLFAGPSGVGKTTLARIVATEVEADLLEVDGATNTGIDKMRELQDITRFKPIGKKNRVVLVDEAHMLSKNAWNSLLKSIEEPPPGLYWIFCTTEPKKVIKTIQTRCLSFVLDTVDTDTIFDLLSDVCDREGYNTSDDVLDLVARKAEGLPRQALTMLSVVADCETRQSAATLLQDITIGEDTDAIELCRALAKNQTSAAIDILRKIKKDGLPAEGVRRRVLAYFEAVAMSAKGADKFAHAAHILESFAKPADSFSDLVVSTAHAL